MSQQHPGPGQDRLHRLRLSPTTTCLPCGRKLADADLITLLIGSNDTVLRSDGGHGRATKARPPNADPPADGHHAGAESPDPPDLKKGLENLDLTPGRAEGRLKLLDSGLEEICDQTRDQTVANVEQILQELRALNPDAQIILVGLLQPPALPPTYGRHFRLLNRSRQGPGPAVWRRLCVHPLYLHCQRRSPHGVRSQVHRSPDPEGRPQVNVSFFQGPACPAGSFCFPAFISGIQLQKLLF